MRTMGIGWRGAFRGEGKEQRKCCIFFDREMWESAKKQMKSEWEVGICKTGAFAKMWRTKNQY